jgi:GntR family transcriptional regulator/MocR family aminotransferase
MIAPPNFLIQAIKLRKLIDRQGEQLLEEAMANLLKNGDISRHLKKANKLYHERRDALCGLLNKHLSNHITFKIPDGGFAIWMNYNHGIDPVKVAQKASELGLSISAGQDYYHDRSNKCNSVRIGFASLNEQELEDAVVILSKAIKKVTEAI